MGIPRSPVHFVHLCAEPMEGGEVMTLDDITLVHLGNRPEPARRLVRQSQLARDLGVSDKRVATWRTRSAVNGFPDPCACHFGPTTRGGKRRHMLWDLGEVRDWFSRYDLREQRARGGHASTRKVK